MIGNGITIFDRNGKIQELKEYVKKLYSHPLLPLTQVEDNEQVVIIANRLVDLKKLCLNNDLYFNRLYHLTIEKIRKYYYQRNGYPEISTSKVLDLYSNPAYSEVIDKEGWLQSHHRTLFLRHLPGVRCLGNRQGLFRNDLSDNRLLIGRKLLFLEQYR